MRLVPLLKMIMARMEDSLRRALWRPSAETELQTVKEDARLLVSLVGSWRVPPGLLKATLALAANQDHRGQNEHVRLMKASLWRTWQWMWRS